MPPRSSRAPAAPCRRPSSATTTRPASACCARSSRRTSSRLPSASSAELKEQDPALVASYGGAGAVLPVRVASRREFTGSWEYLVEDAIFTSPPHPAWSGAALISREGKLIGVGSLIVGDANGDNAAEPRQHVRADRSACADPRRSHRQGPRGRARDGPGSASTRRRCTGGCLSAASRREARRSRPASSAATSSPASTAKRPGRCRSFIARSWALGAAGVTVPLDVLSDSTPRRVELNSVNRLDTLKLQSTF